MKIPWFSLTICLLASAAPLRAGEPVQLDKDFSFRLTQPELQETPPAVSAPPVRLLPERKPAAPLKTAEGDVLPPGSRPFQYNGQTYYLIPL